MPKKGFKKQKHSAPERGARSFKAVGDRLRLTREALELSQADVCRRCEIGANTYSQYESGISRPTVENALRLVDAYGLSLDWIYRGEPGELKSSLLDKIKELGWKPD